MNGSTASGFNFGAAGEAVLESFTQNLNVGASSGYSTKIRSSSVLFPDIAGLPSSGKYCTDVDSTGKLYATSSDCGSSGGSGTVNSAPDGSTATYNATGTAVGAGPQAPVCTGIPNDDTTDASSIINACTALGIPIALPTICQGSKNYIKITKPILAMQVGQVIYGGGYGNGAICPSVIDNVSGASAIVINGGAPNAEATGGITANTTDHEAILYLSLSSGTCNPTSTCALGSTATVVDAGYYTTTTPSSWVIMGTGTPGTATINPTWNNAGSCSVSTPCTLASATVTPGTSSGYFTNSNASYFSLEDNIHDFNITASSFNYGSGILFGGNWTGGTTGSSVVSISRIYVDPNNIGGIVGGGTQNEFISSTLQYNTNQSRTISLGGSGNSNLYFNNSGAIITNGRGGVYFPQDIDGVVYPVTISASTSGAFVVLSDVETITGSKVVFAPTSSAYIFSGTAAINSHNTTTPVYTVGAGANAWLFTAPEKSALATDYPSFTVAASTAAGTLAAGTYCYTMFGTNPSGNTTASPQQCATLGSTGEIIATVAAHPGYQTLGVCGRTSGSQLIMTFSPVIQGTVASTQTWTDTGSISPSGSCPSSSTLYYGLGYKADRIGDVRAMIPFAVGGGATIQQMFQADNAEYAYFNPGTRIESYLQPVGSSVGSGYRGVDITYLATTASGLGDSRLWCLRDATETVYCRDIFNNVETTAVSDNTAYYMTVAPADSTSNQSLKVTGVQINPSTSTITASLNGNVTGNVTGNISGTAAAVNLAASGAGGVTGVLPTANIAVAQTTRVVTVTDIAPATSDDGLIVMLDPATAVQLKRFSCGVTGTTSVITNLVSSSSSLIADMTATAGDVNTVVVTSWVSGSCSSQTTYCPIAAHTPVTLHIGTISGTPTSLSCALEYTVN